MTFAISRPARSDRPLSNQVKVNSLFLRDSSVAIGGTEISRSMSRGPEVDSEAHQGGFPHQESFLRRAYLICRYL